MRTLKTGAGYLLNDDRASGGRKTEADVLCCRHCQRTLIGDAWRQDGGWCGRCGAPVCGVCADRMQTRGCEPFLKVVDAQLTTAARRRQLWGG